MSSVGASFGETPALVTTAATGPMQGEPPANQQPRLPKSHPTPMLTPSLGLASTLSLPLSPWVPVSVHFADTERHANIVTTIAENIHTEHQSVVAA
ncbi:unnamed protein product [Hydatigera taeniaeformis]|uniref:Uncharacterized protein n=1 Tax=Hydatigena taeniaeformis TaxID=6205 RepID=A0A0R3X024_HYDTA|nr:unnamed protein product [Hydatigera taeniaeformis]